MAKPQRPQVITANLLEDGDVVYLAADGTWHKRLQEAHVIPAGEDPAPLLELAQRSVAAQVVVEPYEFDVEIGEDGTVRPISAREIIRAAGPTVRLDLGKQADSHTGQ